MLERDILIIGGGPAGLSTALHLAKDFPHLTSRLLVLEKRPYPRPKLCAGGLVVDAEVILQRLGLDVSEVPHMDAERIHFDFEAKGLDIRVPRRHALRVVRRSEFDHWLAQKAREQGIEVREGVTVKNLQVLSEAVLIQTEQGDFRAQAAVGADGSNGVIRRCLFPGASINTARVLEVIAPAGPAVASAAKQSPRSNSAYIDFAPLPSNIAGYVWDFPTQVNGKAMRCWGIYDTNLLAGAKRPQLKELLAREMSRLGFNLDDYEIKGYPIRLFSPENEMSRPRVLLVGDAAGADPFLGEGISIALGYGALAARELGRAFEQNEFSFHGYRQRVLRSALGQALLARWIISQFAYLLKWKWFQILVWRILKPLTILIARIFVLNWGRRL